MTREDVIKRFNALPIEIRKTMIAVNLDTEIHFLEMEREMAISAHASNLRRIDNRLKLLKKHLIELKDD